MPQTLLFPALTHEHLDASEPSRALTAEPLAARALVDLVDLADFAHVAVAEVGAPVEAEVRCHRWLCACQQRGGKEESRCHLRAGDDVVSVAG